MRRVEFEYNVWLAEDSDSIWILWESRTKVLGCYRVECGGLL